MVSKKPIEPAPGASPMTFKEYEYAAARTAPVLDQSEMLNLAALGLAGEAGKIAALVKRLVIDNGEINQEELTRCMGQALWFMSQALRLLRTPLEQVARTNLDENAKRYGRR
jgi:hypothetical protein